MADPDDSDLIEHALGVLSSSDGDDAAGQATVPALPRHVEDLSGHVLGEFILRRRIGEGSFGVAYRCDQPLLGREAVVKVLRGRLARGGRERFHREAHLASRLSHLYAAHVYAFGVEEDDDFAWIAMELVHGVTLQEWLDTRGPMSLDLFVPFFEKVAEVVQAAHDRGIVHRDLKPSNMMVVLDRAGQLYPKLLDFGIAKLIDVSLASAWPTGTLTGEPRSQAASASASDVSEARPTTSRVGAPLVRPPPNEQTIRQLTRPSAALGTPAYMAPEQSGETYLVGPCSDLYALGVIAYEALTGRRPFAGKTATEYAELHRSAPIPSLGGEFTPALDQVLRCAMAKRPENRWRSALEFSEALIAAANLSPVPANLPRLDEGVRTAWIANAPQPVAESIAALNRARNVHEVRERVQELVHHLLRYLFAVATATRETSGDDEPRLLDLVRALNRRELTCEEHLQFLRALARPREEHPVPELCHLVTLGPDGADALEPILRLYVITDHSGSEESVQTRLQHLLPQLADLLRKMQFLLECVLVVPVGGAAERWMGPRRPERVSEVILDGALVDGHPMLVRNGRVCADLWPLVQVATPSDGADAEMFLFDRRGRPGAHMIAAPRSLVRDDVDAWRWIASHLITEVETKARMREHVQTAACQWRDRGRPAELLWRGTVLAEFESWRARTSPQLGEIEAEFAKASQEQEAEFARAIREREQKEISDAKARRRRVSRIRRWLAAGVAVAAVTASEYRGYLKAEMLQEVAERSLTQAEVEQGRQALLHGEFTEARQHLGAAYQRGDRSPETEFMLSRALQPWLAERARFSAASGRMWSSMFSPDGTRIITTDDRVAQIRDTASGQLLFTLPHMDTVYAATFTPGGRILTASGDGTVGVWEATGRKARELRHPSARPRWFRIAASGVLVSAVDIEGKIACIWNLETGTIAELTGDGSALSPSVAFSSSGRWLAIGGGDDARVFDTRGWMHAITLHGPGIRSLAWAPSGTQLATGTAAGDTAVFDVSRGVELWRIHDRDPIDVVAWSPDNSMLAVAARDGVIQIYDAATGVRRSSAHGRGRVQALEFSPDGTRVAAAGANGYAILLDAATAIVTTELGGTEQAMQSLHWAPDGHRMLGASWDGSARIWDSAPSYRRWGSEPVPGGGCGLLTGGDPDARYQAVGCTHGATRVWDTYTGRVLAQLPSVSAAGADREATFPAVSMDGTRAAIARGTVVEIYDLLSKLRLRSIERPAAVSALAFQGLNTLIGDSAGGLAIAREDGRVIEQPTAVGAIDAVLPLGGDRVAVADASLRLRVIAAGVVAASEPTMSRTRLLRASGDRLVVIPVLAGAISPPTLWDVRELHPIARLGGDSALVFSARFIPGGVLTASNDSVVRLWDAATGVLRHRYSGHYAMDATTDPTGRFVVTGDGIGGLFFWEANSERPLWRFQAHSGYVLGIQFDGADLVTRGFSGEMARWTLPKSHTIIAECASRRPACGIVVP